MASSDGAANACWGSIGSGRGVGEPGGCGKLGAGGDRSAAVCKSGVCLGNRERAISKAAPARSPTRPPKSLYLHGRSGGGAGRCGSLTKKRAEQAGAIGHVGAAREQAVALDRPGQAPLAGPIGGEAEEARSEENTSERQPLKRT